MKKETLEEAAERLLSKEGVKLHPSGLETYLKGNVINAMVEMAEWQQERSYSEEEVENILIEYVKTNPSKPYRVVSWFTQFKRNNK